MTRERSLAVLCAGETMALVTPSNNERIRVANNFRLDVGGAESNVAVHLAALGRPCRLFSRFGNDEIGHRVIEQIGSRGVNLEDLVFDSERPTGVYFKDPGNGVLYYRAGSAASVLSKFDARDLRLDGVELIHLTGITPALSPTAAEFVEELMARASRASIQISFDVNHRPSLWAAGAAPGALKSFAERADVLLIGLDEAELLWKTTTPRQVRDIFPEVPTLVIKDGDVGATEFTSEGEHFEPAIPTEVVEVVGAGDAFAAGYLDRYLAEATSQERLRAGHKRAVIALQTTTDSIPAGVPDEYGQ